MKKKYILTAMAMAAVLTACQAPALTEDDVFVSESNVEQMLKDANPEGYTIYTLDDFTDAFMTVKGSYSNDTTPYRTRSKTPCGWELFSIDTIPSQGKGVYIRGRVSTDDFGGNFYKSLVIQQVVDGEQQNLRISVDMGSIGGMYQIGQEILIRCNGLCIGRYANQPQLCVPSYNDNIFANNAAEKVGWAPGRISSAVFRNATTLIGKPDQSKLKYDTVSLKEIFEVGNDSEDWYRKAAQLDGRLVVVKGVHFTGQYENNGSFVNLTTGDPEDDTNANVFAPTTENIGYPQSRVISDYNNSTRFLVSNSEYAKFARFYIPGANEKGVTLCSFYEGTITGILGWYLDNAKSAKKIDNNTYDQDGYEWSITPRGIKGFGMDDIKMFNDQEKDPEWKPTEYKKPEAAAE